MSGGTGDRQRTQRPLRLHEQVLRLTLLAPDLVKAILDGRQPHGKRLESLLDGFPVEWTRQRSTS